MTAFAALALVAALNGVSGTILSPQDRRGSEPPPRFRAPDAILQSVGEGDIAALVHDVLEVAGRRNERVVVRASTDVKSAAAIERDGTTMVLYNPIFLGQLSRSAQTGWAVVFVVAHELAHHLSGHAATPFRGSKEVMELEADELAGFVLATLGAEIEDADRTIVMADRILGPLVPDTAARLKAIARGWKGPEALRGIVPPGTP